MTATELPGELLALPQPGKKNPETRMKDAVKCRELVRKAIKDDEQRGWRRALAKGCYDGHRPYTKVAKGYGWVCNLNFQEMEGLLDGARIPYYALFSGVETFTTFTTAYQPENPESARWNKIIERKWTALLNRWKSFRWHMKAREFEMLFDGWGPLMFESPTDWRFTAFPARCVKVAKDTWSCVDERLPFIVLLRDYRIHELWEKIADADSAKARGWNVKAVQTAIKNAGNSGANVAEDWEAWQRRLANADLCESYTSADVVRCGIVLVKEYAKGSQPGKISEFIVTVNDLGDQDKETGDYLYSAPNQYAHYHEAINICFQNTGDGTWHSVRGLGLKAFKHIEVSNRLKCRAVDNAFLAAGPIVQPGTNKSKDQLELTVFGPVTYLAPGATFIQHRLAGDIQGVLAVDRVLSNHLAQNVGHYNQRSISRDDGRGEQPTATQVELQAGKETSLTQAQIDAYYDDLDTLYEQMFERARKGPDEESRRFLRECEEAGVPKQALEQMECVKANRLSGYPSPEMRRRNYRELAGLMAMLPEDGRRNLIDEGISIYAGPDKIAVFNPRMEKPDLDAAFAVLENAAMSAGEQPLVISGMNHVTHLQIHLQDAAEKMEPLSEAMDEGGIAPEALEQAYRYLAILGPHAEEHLAPLKSDPSRKQLADMFRLQLTNLAAFHGKLRGAILDARRDAQQAALEAQNATALGVMDQAKLASEQADIQRQDMKAAADVRRKDWKTQESQRLKTWATAQNQRLNAAKTAGDLRIKSMSANGNGKST